MKIDDNKKNGLDVKPDEKEILIDHIYDGIQELNHPLPSWWNFLFWACIVYSGGYFIYYEYMSGPSLEEEFIADYKKIQTVQEEYKTLNSAFQSNLFTVAANPAGIKKGKEVFENNCLPCHSDNGKGDIGPNLTDKYWIVAKSTPQTIYEVSFRGSEENGMPPWGDVLTSDELYFVVSYVSSLKNTHQKGGKTPQGELVEE